MTVAVVVVAVGLRMGGVEVAVWAEVVAVWWSGWE